MAKTKGPALNAVKQRAIQTLKRKKMFEQQRDNLSAQSFNIEQVWGYYNYNHNVHSVYGINICACSQHTHRLRSRSRRRATRWIRSRP